MSDIPLRIQRRRTRGWRMPPNTASVDQERLAGAAIHRLGTTVVRRDNRPQKTPRKSEV